MIQYFRKFPTVEYDISGSKERTLVSNILHRVRIRDVINQNMMVYNQWILEDGDSPEIIAYKYYGSTKYFWLVMFSNDVFDLYYDWLLSYDDFIAFIIKQYGSVQIAYQTIHHYEDILGNEIDKTTYDSLADNERLSISAYDYYFNLNEQKRFIKLLDKSYLGQVEQEIDNLLNITE
jgi:hypothetical protein